MDILQIIKDVVLLLIPAGVANMMPVIAAKYMWVPSLNKPIDGGREILGNNKTYRGLVVGVLFGSITGYIIYLVAPVVPYHSLLDALLFGAVTGFGALAGDVVKSFFKRRLRISSGKPWRPFDQIDFVIGALIAATFLTSITWHDVVVAILLFGALSFATSYIGHALRIKKSI